MATLEVHDGRGRVERVRVAHEQPAMFGSSPKCEIVLAGEGILPFHGRLRWQPKKNRFKVDASPEAEYLLVNGHKMASSGFRQGDEVQVGTYRIFMIHEGEPQPAEPPARDDVTRVQPPPFLAPTQHTQGAVLPRASWRGSLEAAPPSGESAATETPRPRRRGRDRPDRPGGKQSEPRGFRARLAALFGWVAAAPGEERVFSSPLVFGLALALAVLAAVGFSLYEVISRTAASRLYTEAVGSLDDGDYRNAIRRFDEFLAANPKDARAAPARVHRAMANVRQYTAASGASWSLALEAERAMAEGLGGSPGFQDSASELDELVLRTGEALADRARASADAKTLAEAESAVALHGSLAGQAAGALLKKSRLPEKLASARAAVRKGQARRDRLAAMDAAIKAGSSTGVYAARDALVAAYADLADDRDLLARMNRANDLIRKAVTVDASGRPADTTPRPDPLGPATTLVLRAPDPPPAAKDGPPVFALADGTAYALEGASGTPLWQAPVGLSSPYPPQPIPGGTTVLVCDARHDDLLRLDARTGKLVWRQSLGEPVSDPPLVLGNQVVQATPGGKLLVIDLAGGALRAAVDLHTPLTRTPVGDESGRALFAVAAKDVAFVLTRDPLGCAAVHYLGHAAGSVACPPARVGPYLIVAENHRLNESRWRAFLVDPESWTLTPVQNVPVLGWTWGTPASAGSVVWATGDRGGVAAHAVGAPSAKDPFRLIARIPPDVKPSGPAFALARSEREVWVGSGRSGRYELDPEGGKLTATWTLSEAGPALAPPQTVGKLLVLTQQHAEGPGAALWGVDPLTGSVRWRTVLGAPWPSSPEPADGGKTLAALGADGRPLTLTRDALAAGGFVTSTLPKPGGFRLPAGPVARVEGDGWTAVVAAPGSSRLLVRSDGKDFREVRLPAAVGARPVAWGKDLLLPGGDGRAYLIDPTTGESRAEPYVPPFDRARPTRWRAPVRLSGDAVALADDAGRVRRLIRVNDPRPRLVVSAEAALGHEPVSEAASAGGAFVVATADGQARALAARDLSPVGAWPLSGPPATPPAAVGGLVYLTDASGGVVALGGDGLRLWSADLGPTGEGVAVVGPPAVRGRAAWFLTRDGTLHARSLDDGSPVAAAPLNVLPAGGPLAVGDDLAVPVGPGSLRLFLTR